MIIGRSKLRKDLIYVDKTTPQVLAEAAKEGYEVFELGRPIYLALKTEAGACSGPTRYSARHCWGGPLTEVRGRPYEIAGYEAVGRVVKDYSPPLRNLFVLIAGFFGFSWGVKDTVRVSLPMWASDKQVAVVSAAPLDRPVGLFAPIPAADPIDVVGKEVVVSVDVPEQDDIGCVVLDYAVVHVFVDGVPWPHDEYIATCKKQLRPGNSGGAVYLRQ
jgi:hypothetical protein